MAFYDLRVYQPIGSMLVMTNQTFSSYLIDYVDQHSINRFGLNRLVREITGWSLSYDIFKKTVKHRLKLVHGLIQQRCMLARLSWRG